MTAVEIEIDGRGRASLNAAGAKQGRYRAERVGDVITLTPVQSFTRAELLAIADGNVREAIAEIRSGAVTLESPDDLP